MSRVFQARIQRPCSTVAARAYERRPSSSSSSRCCSRRFSGDRDVPIDPRACSSNGANSSPIRGQIPPRQHPTRDGSNRLVSTGPSVELLKEPDALSHSRSIFTRGSRLTTKRCLQIRDDERARIPPVYT